MTNLSFEDWVDSLSFYDLVMYNVTSLDQVFHVCSDSDWYKSISEYDSMDLYFNSYEFIKNNKAVKLMKKHIINLTAFDREVKGKIRKVITDYLIENNLKDLTADWLESE